jgi:hypothetical protein
LLIFRVTGRVRSVVLERRILPVIDPSLWRANQERGEDLFRWI